MHISKTDSHMDNHPVLLAIDKWWIILIRNGFNSTAKINLGDFSQSGCLFWFFIFIFSIQRRLIVTIRHLIDLHIWGFSYWKIIVPLVVPSSFDFFVCLEVLHCYLCIWRSSHFLLPLEEKYLHQSGWLGILRCSQTFSVDVPTPQLFFHLRGKFLRLHAFYWFHKARPEAESLLFVFPGALPCNAQVCEPSLNARVRSAFCMCLQAVCKGSCLLSMGTCAWSWP